jgi:hypothetical protein
MQHALCPGHAVRCDGSLSQWHSTIGIRYQPYGHIVPGIRALTHYAGKHSGHGAELTLAWGGLG